MARSWPSKTVSGISSIPGIGCPVVINSTICAKEVGYAGSEEAVPDSADDCGCDSPVFKSDPDSCCVAVALAVGEANQAL